LLERRRSGRHLVLSVLDGLLYGRSGGRCFRCGWRHRGRLRRRAWCGSARGECER